MKIPDLLHVPAVRSWLAKQCLRLSFRLVPVRLPAGDGEPRRYELSRREDARANQWVRDHELRHRGEDAGAIGGRYTVCFTGTGLGNIAHIRCGSCGTEACLTDFDDW